MRTPRIGDLSYSDLLAFRKKCEKTVRICKKNIGAHYIGENNLSKNENEKWIKHDLIRYEQADFLYRTCWDEIRKREEVITDILTRDNKELRAKYKSDFEVLHPMVKEK